MLISITKALELVEQGGIIAYPTEAVYGLGCDPFNTQSIEKLINIKGRAANKGLIVLISHMNQLKALTAGPPTKKELATLDKYWPGPYTFLFRKNANLPPLLCGDSEKIAIRMSAHPIASALSEHAPLISTSANLSGQPPCVSGVDIINHFSQGIDGIVDGKIGHQAKPSTIIDLETLTVIRE